MVRLRVVPAQIPVTTDIARNEEVILRALSFAAAQQADILLTPEGSLSGYTPDFDSERLEAALRRVERSAKAQGVGLALGTCRKENGLCYNQLRFYDRDGVFLGDHAKILRCGTVRGPREGECLRYAAKPLRTFLFHGVRIGGLICNDMWATPDYTPEPDPHLLLQLADMGAQVVFHAVNGGRGEDMALYRAYHESNLLLRARAAGIPIVTVDNSEPSRLPVASWGGVIGPEGARLMRLPEQGEQMAAYTIELP